LQYLPQTLTDCNKTWLKINLNLKHKVAEKCGTAILMIWFTVKPLYFASR